MKNLYLDLYPTYIPFIVQCTKGTGDKVDPTVDNLIVYEESGVDITFDSTTITGSPFNPEKINSKTGLWGVLIPKTAFTVNKFYIALWEMTVDSITTAKVERYFSCNSSSFKADVSGLATQTSVNTIDGIVDAILEDTTNIPVTGEYNTALSNLSTKIDTIDNIVDELKSVLIVKSATVIDVSPTVQRFNTSLTEINDYWNSGAILWNVGSANAGVIRAIKDYANSNGELTMNTNLPVAPVNGDAFRIIMARAFHLSGLEASEITDACTVALNDYDQAISG